MKKILRYLNRIFDSNKGSTLITVIVAIAFVTILTTIILGTTLVNVRMKGIDRRTKNDFYYAERSLNDIYTGLGQELALIAGNEYNDAFKKVGDVEEREVIQYDEHGDPILDADDNPVKVKVKVDYNQAEHAEKDFRTKFMKKAREKADELIVKNESGKYALEGYILDTSKGTVEKIKEVQYQKKDGSKVNTPDEASRVVIKEVQISVEDSMHYKSTITTDIVITIPTVDFLGTNADVSDYGLIANKGLYITGGSSGCEITGNVYAGVHDTPNAQDGDYKERTDDYSRGAIYGGINIKDGKATFDGNYIVSKGDINLTGTNPQIKVNSPKVEGGDVNLANLWCTSIRTISNRSESFGVKGAQITNDYTKPTIDINANIFALNDMALNADNSSVIIKGNYYGYNEGGLSYVLGKKEGRYDGENSSIIVNGSKAYLDMRDINNFVLMGKAYIDFTSDKDTDVSAMGTAPQVVPTAESVALKTNQQLYLVPNDFLDGANPVEVSGGSHSFNISIPVGDLEKWFGYDYLKTDVQPDATKAPTSMHTAYKVTLSSGSDVWYDYLVFDDNTNWKPSAASSLADDTDDEKYIVKKIKTESGYDYKIVKYTRSSEPVGTGGSISSKAMFFLKIMMSRNAYDYALEHGAAAGYIEEKENEKVQPSEYRLYERINRSMDYDYFDLKQCVVGDTANTEKAHYYAKNAVINYERDDADKIQSNVLDNTDGMLRYAGYQDKLYKRYILLCTRLDAKEKVLLDGDPAPGKGITSTDWPEWVIKYDDVKKAAPMCHFVDIARIPDSMTITGSSDAASAEPYRLMPTTYGCCVATKGNLTLSAVVGSTFKGVAIVDGDIIVPEGLNVEGLLMATGTITLKGNNHITYDKGLIQSRIEKEMNIVKGNEGAAYQNFYVINYLSRDNSVGTPELIYQVEAGSKIRQERIEADYNDFMHYENWQKGEK